MKVSGEEGEEHVPERRNKEIQTSRHSIVYYKNIFKKIETRVTDLPDCLTYYQLPRFGPLIWRHIFHADITTMNSFRHQIREFQPQIPFPYGNLESLLPITLNLCQGILNPVILCQYLSWREMIEADFQDVRQCVGKMCSII